MYLQKGTILQRGKYTIESVLGQGGFGITYLASMTIDIKEPLGVIRSAIKVTIKEFFMNNLCIRDDRSHVSVPSAGSKEQVDSFRRKFRKEAVNLSKLNHPHIIKVSDVFEENGTTYYVMEYIEGGSLSEYIKSHGPMEESKAVRYIRQIADALDYLHSRKMNHLDVKPGNILLNTSDDAILIDFGLSKHYDEEGQATSTTPVGISHGYAPMEQYKRGGVNEFSPATDIYSLGATLYKLLTGQTPPDASDINDEGLPTMPNNISTSTKRAVESAMQPRRKDRPQNVRAFLSLLNICTDKDSDITEILVPQEDNLELDNNNNVKSNQSTNVKPQIERQDDFFTVFKRNWQKRNRLTNFILTACFVGGVGLLLIVPFIIKTFVLMFMCGITLLMYGKKIGLYIIASLFILFFYCGGWGFRASMSTLITFGAIVVALLLEKNNISSWQSMTKCYENNNSGINPANKYLTNIVFATLMIVSLGGRIGKIYYTFYNGDVEDLHICFISILSFIVCILSYRDFLNVNRLRARSINMRNLLIAAIAWAGYFFDIEKIQSNMGDMEEWFPYWLTFAFVSIFIAFRFNNKRRKRMLQISYLSLILYLFSVLWLA